MAAADANALKLPQAQCGAAGQAGSCDAGKVDDTGEMLGRLRLLKYCSIVLNGGGTSH